MHEEVEHEDHEEAALRAITHPQRRELLRLLTSKERSVGELAAESGMAQPATSQHLKVLRDAGLVTVQVDGNRRIYSVDFEALAAVRAFLDDFWRDSLDALRRAAEDRS